MITFALMWGITQMVKHEGGPVNIDGCVVIFTAACDVVIVGIIVCALGMK